MSVEVVGIVDPPGASGSRPSDAEGWTLHFALQPWRSPAGSLEECKLAIRQPHLSRARLQELMDRLQPYDILRIQVRFITGALDSGSLHAELLAISNDERMDPDLIRRAAEMRRQLAVGDPLARELLPVPYSEPPTPSIASPHQAVESNNTGGPNGGAPAVRLDTPSLERLMAKLAARGIDLPPPLSEAEVAAFEHRHQIRLPEEYREFLARVGNGGPGPPFYGLLPLGATSDGGIPEWFANGYDGLLAEPFPLSTYWVWETDEEIPDLEDRLASLRFGNLCLGTDGCGLYWLLIVSGPERGQIWSVGDGAIQPLAPRHTFHSWYEYWLDGGDDWYRDFVYETDTAQETQAAAVNGEWG